MSNPGFFTDVKYAKSTKKAPAKPAPTGSPKTAPKQIQPDPTQTFLNQIGVTPKGQGAGVLQPGAKNPVPAKPTKPVVPINRETRNKIKAAGNEQAYQESLNNPFLDKATSQQQYAKGPTQKLRIIDPVFGHAVEKDGYVNDPEQTDADSLLQTHYSHLLEKANTELPFTLTDFAIRMRSGRKDDKMIQTKAGGAMTLTQAIARVAKVLSVPASEITTHSSKVTKWINTIGAQSSRGEFDARRNRESVDEVFGKPDTSVMSRDNLARTLYEDNPNIANDSPLITGMRSLNAVIGNPNATLRGMTGLSRNDITEGQRGLEAFGDTATQLLSTVLTGGAGAGASTLARAGNFAGRALLMDAPQLGVMVHDAGGVVPAFAHIGNSIKNLGSAQNPEEVLSGAMGIMMAFGLAHGVKSGIGRGVDFVKATGLTREAMGETLLRSAESLKGELDGTDRKLIAETALRLQNESLAGSASEIYSDPKIAKSAASIIFYSIKRDHNLHGGDTVEVRLQDKLRMSHEVPGEANYNPPTVPENPVRGTEAPIDSSAPQKEFWQMPIDEFMATDYAKSLDNPNTAVVHWELAVKDAYKAGNEIPRDVLQNYPDLAPHLLTKAEYDRANYLGYTKDMRQRGHKFWLEKALSEGKEVPDHVLADYPDLKINEKIPQTQEIPQVEAVPVAKVTEGSKASAAKEGLGNPNPATEPVKESGATPKGNAPDLAPKKVESKPVETPEQSADPIIREAHKADDVTWDKATEAEYKKGPKKAGLTTKQREFLIGKLKDNFGHLPEKVEPTYGKKKGIRGAEVNDPTILKGFSVNGDASKGVEIAVPGDGTYTVHSQEQARGLAKAIGESFDPPKPIAQPKWLTAAGGSVKIMHGEDVSGNNHLAFKDEPKYDGSTQIYPNTPDADRSFNILSEKMGTDKPGSPEKSIVSALNDGMGKTKYVKVTFENGDTEYIQKIYADEIARRGLTLEQGQSSSLRVVDNSGELRGFLQPINKSAMSSKFEAPYIKPKPTGNRSGARKPLAQAQKANKPKGSYIWDEATQKGILTLNSNADASTVIHELQHHFLQTASGQTKANIASWALKQPTTPEQAEKIMAEGSKNPRYVRIQESFAYATEQSLKGKSQVPPDIQEAMDAYQGYVANVKESAKSGNTKLTPHDSDFDKLMGEILGGEITQDHSKAFAREVGNVDEEATKNAGTMTHAQTEVVREVLGAELYQKTVKPDEQTIKDASKHRGKSQQFAARLEDGKPLSDSEQIALGLDYQDSLRGRQEILDKYAPGQDLSKEDAQALADHEYNALNSIRTLDKAGSEAGRSLRIRQLVLGNDYSNQGITTAFVKASGKMPDRAQAAKIAELTATIEELESKVGRVTKLRKVKYDEAVKYFETTLNQNKPLNQLSEADRHANAIAIHLMESGMTVKEAVAQMEKITGGKIRGSMAMNSVKKALSVMKGKNTREAVAAGEPTPQEINDARGKIYIHQMQLADMIANEGVNAAWREAGIAGKTGIALRELRDSAVSVVSSTDFSGTRQALYGLLVNPKSSGRTFLRQFKNMKTSHYDEWIAGLQSEPQYWDALDNGLDIQGKPNFKEEAFRGRAIEKVPGIGQIVGGSDRAYSTVTTGVRYEVYKTLVKYAKTKAEKQLIADFANIVTGRAGTGKLKTLTSGDLPRSILWAPSFMASRMQHIALPVRIFRSSASVGVKARLLGEWAKPIAAISGIMYGVARVTGGKFIDDRDDKDFLAVILPDGTKYDPWAGSRQVVRLGLDMINPQRKGEWFDQGKDQIKRVFDFTVEGKANPMFKTGMNLARREDTIGGRFGMKEAALSPTPLFLKQTYEDAMDEGGMTQQDYIGMLGNAFGVFDLREKKSQEYYKANREAAKKDQAKPFLEYITSP